MFARHGIPDIVTLDNGSQIKDFAESRGFKHITSSLNGQSEKSTQTIKMKNSECNNDRPYSALLGYYNTPQLPMRCRLKRKLQAVERKARETKLYYDRQTRQLSDLLAGENVRTQREEIWKPAMVLHKHEQPLSFVARTSDGRM